MKIDKCFTLKFSENSKTLLQTLQFYRKTPFLVPGISVDFKTLNSMNIPGARNGFLTLKSTLNSFFELIFV